MFLFLNPSHITPVCPISKTPFVVPAPVHHAQMAYMSLFDTSLFGLKSFTSTLYLSGVMTTIWILDNCQSDLTADDVIDAAEKIAKMVK